MVELGQWAINVLDIQTKAVALISESLIPESVYISWLKQAFRF